MLACASRCSRRGCASAQATAENTLPSGIYESSGRFQAAPAPSALITRDSISGNWCIVGSTATCLLPGSGGAGGTVTIGGFTSTPTFNIGGIGASATAANQTAIQGTFGSTTADRVVLHDSGGNVITFNDTRAVDQSLASTLNAAVTVATDGGVATVRGYLSGVAGGANVIIEGSNDSAAATPHWAAITVIQGNVVVPSSTLTADGSFTINMGGRTAWRARTSVAGTGTMKVSYSMSTAPVVVDALVEGPAATLANATGNPVRNGCVARAATPTAGTDGQMVDELCGAEGKKVYLPYALKENMLRGTAASTDTSAHSLIAAQGASVKIYPVALQCSNTSATDAMVTLNDTASTSFIVPHNSGNNPVFPIPLALALNTALTFTSGTGVTTLTCNAQAFGGV
jgi:hypothetical protein